MLTDYHLQITMVTVWFMSLEKMESAVMNSSNMSVNVILTRTCNILFFFGGGSLAFTCETMMLFLQPCQLKAAFKNDFGKQSEKRSDGDLCVRCSIHADLSPGSSLVCSSSSAVFDGGGCGVCSLALSSFQKSCNGFLRGNPTSFFFLRVDRLHCVKDWKRFKVSFFLVRNHGPKPNEYHWPEKHG